VPPSSAYQWSGAANSSAWSAGGNWVGGAAPTLNADVLFGDLPSNGPEVAVNVNNGSKTLKALWFDAGKWYTLSGANLTLGGGLASESPVITVNADWSGMSEINIDNNINFNFAGVSGNTGIFRFLEITNHSEGGLRLGGTVSFSNGDFQGFSVLRVGGHGATHFANAITGFGLIQTNNNQTTHLVLSGNNANWRGVVSVTAESLAFIKRNNALPGIGWGGNSQQARAGVSSGGTLGFRSHGHGPSLNYSSNHAIQVQGQGAVRQWGRPPVGAVYNDGGQNTFAGGIQMAGDTWFGSRGDRNGGLTLTGQIIGGNYSFTKVGPGLITLTNTNNTWTGNTYLNGGVLRLTDLNALPTYTKNLIGTNVFLTTHQLVFNGGILEFANTSGPNYPYHYYFLGNGAGQTSWTGSGGFSASGGTHAVVITSQTQPYAPVLEWGQNGFVPLGKELLLSSRYANAPIVLPNPIAPGGATIRVERGLTADAWALISGTLSGASKADFTKTGAGLLILSDTNSNYVGQTRISDGALGGFIPMTSNINLRGGVVMLGNLDDANATTFTRNVGSAVGQVQWTSSSLSETGGGFAAWAGDQTVKLNNNTSLINWAPGNFVEIWKSLKFGHYTASGTVIWDKQLGLGNDGERKIYIERGRDLSRADVVFSQQITGAASFRVEGDGRMDIRVNNPNLQSTLNIYGAELRLHSAGRLPFVPRINIAGGTLTLDNRGTHNSTGGGYYTANRLNSSAIINMSGGSLRFWGRGAGAGASIQQINSLVTSSGAINIDMRNALSNSYTQFRLKYIERFSYEHNVSGSVGPVSTSTLNLTSGQSYFAGESLNTVSLRFSNWGDIINTPNPAIPETALTTRTNYEINDHEQGDKILPWATVKGQDWVMPKKSGNYTYLIALPQYHTNIDTTTWDLSRNVSLSQIAPAQLDSSRTINSLRLIGQANLGLDKFNLTLNSGGLLSNGRNKITSNSGARLMGVQGVMGKQTQRPFYAHIYNGHLEIGGRASIYSDYEFVKTGDGTLTLNSAATHYFGKSLYINQGTLSLRQGRMQMGSQLPLDGIFISSGTALELPSHSWDSIIGGLGGAPNIFLSGTPYGPGAQYGGEEAILRMGGNTKLHINEFVIGVGSRNHGTIDWYGGEVGKANILWIEELVIFQEGSDLHNGAYLFMRNWYQYEDILLVRKGLWNSRILPRIIFEGYEDFPVLAIDYDANYWQITPFHSPEPSTYGAILGGVGLVLWGWRRKRRRAVSGIHLARRTDDGSAG